jgi:hypothetical protein
MAREITCIIRDGDDPDYRIDGVGGSWGSKGARTVIEEIEAGADYFVEVDGTLVDVVVAEQDGRKYLGTDPDRTTHNNLNSLPSCPSERYLPAGQQSASD